MEVGRGRALEQHFFSGSGVAETEPDGMKRLARKDRQPALPASIERIPEECVADMGHMDPDLVRAAGFQPAGDMRRACAESGLDPVVRNRVPTALGHRHAFPVARVAPDRRIDPPDGGRRQTLHQRPIPAVNVMRLEQRPQAGMGRFRLRRHQQSGGVLVEAVHDAGPRDAANAGQLRAAMLQQRVHQCAAGMAGGGMHHHARRLVHDDQMHVLMHHCQRDRLGFGFGRAHRRHIDTIKLSGHRLARRGRDAPLGNQRLYAGAGKRRDRLRQHAVQPLAVGLGRRDGFEDRVFFARCHEIVSIPMTLAHNYGKSAARAGSGKQEMGLKALVIGMGVAIIVGVAIVLVTIVNRSLAPTAAGDDRWQLPQGAQVKDWRVAGDDLVIRLEKDGAVLFWTFDRRSGQRLGEVRLEPVSKP